MKLYRDNDGKWVGTQAEAGNKDVIEVPTDKPALLEWLNANCRNSESPAGDREQPADNHSTAGSDPGQPALPKVETCLRCKWTPKMQRQYVDSLLRRLNFEAIETAIEKLGSNYLGRALTAVLDRAKELADEANTPREPSEHRSQPEDG